MQVPSRKPHKRIGGAPFRSPASSARGRRFGDLLPAKKDDVRVQPSNFEPSSSSSAPVGRACVMSATPRHHSADGATRGCGGDSCREGRPRGHGDGTRSPCLTRAQEYVSKLMGEGGKADIPLDWPLVQELDAVDYANRESSKKHEERQRRLENLKALESQREDRNRVEKERDEGRRKWRQEMEADAVLYKQEELDKRARDLSRRRQFDDARRRQLDDTKVRDLQQREIGLKEDQSMAANAIAAKRAEEEKEDARKQWHKKQALVMAVEARAAREKKEQVKRDDHTNDIEMAKKQSELLDKQERERSSFMAEKRNKMSKMLEAYEAGVGNELARLAAEDEYRATRDRKEKDEREVQQMQRKQLQLQRMRDAGKAAVNQQLMDHGAARQKAKDDEIEYARKMNKLVDDATATENAKQDAKALARQTNAEYLRKQIREKSNVVSAKIARDQMSEVERQLNHDKLVRAKDPTRDDGLQGVIQKKRAEYKAATAAH